MIQLIEAILLLICVAFRDGTETPQWLTEEDAGVDQVCGKAGILAR